jgi:hypothetical protein
MLARGHPERGIDAIRSQVGTWPNRTDFSKPSLKQMSEPVSSLKHHYTRFETALRHPIDLFMGGYWISALKRLANASSRSPHFLQFRTSPASTTATLEVPLYYTATHPRYQLSFRWGEGDLGGEVKRERHYIEALV